MHTESLGDLVILDIHSVCTMYSERGAKARRSNRPFWGLCYKYEGETVYQANGEQYISNRAHIMLLPKGCDYEWECIAAGHFCMIEFEAALTHTTPFTFEVSNAERLLKQFSELEYKRISSSITEFESIATLYGILTHLLQNEGRHYLPSEKQQRIAPAVEYLAKHYTERIRNEELASLVGLSCVYFRRLFTEMMGTSPIDYLHSLRIKKAKEMLESDYGSVSDIAFSVGYPDIYDFSRSFKKHTGLSPIQYKKKIRT